MGANRHKIIGQQLSKEQQKVIDIARMKAFAALYCIKYTEMNGAVEAIRKHCSMALGVSERMLRIWERNPIVAEQIRMMLEKAAKKYNRKADDILSEWAGIGFANIMDYLEPDGKGGYKLRDLSALAPEIQRCIKKIEMVQTVTKVPGSDPDNPTEVVETKTKFELHDKMDALEKLGRYEKLIDRAKEGEGLVGAEPVRIYIPDNGRGSVGEVMVGVKFRDTPKEIGYEESK